MAASPYQTGPQRRGAGSATPTHLVALQQRVHQRLPQQHAVCEVLDARGAAGAVVKADGVADLRRIGVGGSSTSRRYVICYSQRIDVWCKVMAGPMLGIWGMSRASAPALPSALHPRCPPTPWPPGQCPSHRPPAAPLSPPPRGAAGCRRLLRPWRGRHRTGSEGSAGGEAGGGETEMQAWWSVGVR